MTDDRNQVFRRIYFYDPVTDRMTEVAVDSISETDDGELIIDRPKVVRHIVLRGGEHDG